MSGTRAAILSVLAVMLVGGCDGSDGDDVTNIINSLFRGPLAFTANGGAAFGNATSAFGGRGGDLDLNCAGNIFMGVNPPPLSPELPSAPTTGTPVVSWSNTQIISTGNAIVNGTITGDASIGTTATLIVEQGDLVINGTIASADNGAAEINLEVIALAGTVWINGAIRTGNVDGTANGDDAGSLLVFAQRIIFTGTIDTRGEGNLAGDGGNGGAVNFGTDGIGGGPTSQILAGGTVNLSGGAANGPDVTGGTAGSFATNTFNIGAATSAIHVQGTVFSLNGGAATGTGDVAGGFGGTLDLQGNAGVFFNADLSAVGGAATSGDAGAFGGNGGSLIQNDLAVQFSGPCHVFGAVRLSGGAATGAAGGLIVGGDGGFIDIDNGTDANLGTGTYSLRGGNSSGAGGNGGTAVCGIEDFVGGDIYFSGVIDVSDGSGTTEVQGGLTSTVFFLTDRGDIQVSGSLILNGGDGSSSILTDGPSPGGTVLLQAGSGDVEDAGSITLRGSIIANGGSDSDDVDDNDGALGGQVRFLCDNVAGSIYLDPGSTIRVDGGNAGGVLDSYGGDGGLVELLTGGGSVIDATVGGNISMRGTILARGGSGLPSLNSFGGRGGAVVAESDSAVAIMGGADGRGGAITLFAGSTIDVSGGFGGFGGDALNDFTTPSVTSPVAVIFDADGVDSDDPSENGIVRNLGTILGLGGAFDGNGGDVLFDGLDVGLAVGPAPGFLDLSGSGAGFLGDFLSQ